MRYDSSWNGTVVRQSEGSFQLWCQERRQGYGGYQSFLLSVGCLRGIGSVCFFPPPIQDVLHGDGGRKGEEVLKDLANWKRATGGTCKLLLIRLS